MPNLLEKFKFYIEPDGSDSNDFLTEFTELSNQLVNSLDDRSTPSVDIINSLKSLFDYRDNDGNAPLHLAVKKKRFYFS